MTNNKQLLFKNVSQFCQLKKKKCIHKQNWFTIGNKLSHFSTTCSFLYQKTYFIKVSQVIWLDYKFPNKEKKCFSFVPIFFFCIPNLFQTSNRNYILKTFHFGGKSLSLTVMLTFATFYANLLLFLVWCLYLFQRH